MTNKTSLLGKYASEVLTRVVAPALEDVHISGAPTDDPLAREDVIFRMTTEWKT